MNRSALDREITQTALRLNQRYGNAKESAQVLRQQLVKLLHTPPVLFVGASVLGLWAWRRFNRLKKTG